MFRRRGGEQGPLDHAALEANCDLVIAELSEDFDWSLPDRRAFVRRVAERCAAMLMDDLAAAAEPATLRRLLEREACAEYFADLYDDLVRGGHARTRALTELFRPEEIETPEGPRPVYRGYLYRASIFQVARWTRRKGWSPPTEEIEELARATAESVVMVLLRSVDLREGRRAFWSYLSRTVEHRAIDQLRLLGRRQGTVSLEAITERRERDGEGPAMQALERDPADVAASTVDLQRLMEDARLTPEERFSLIAGAYGLSDAETAAELGRRIARSVSPADIRRWRFRGRDKVRRQSESDG